MKLDVLRVAGGPDDIDGVVDEHGEFGRDYFEHLRRAIHHIMQEAQIPLFELNLAVGRAR